MEVIAEKVETERQVVDILELNVGYGQGNLFGEPRAIRDAVLAETDPPPDFMRSSLRRRGMRGPCVLRLGPLARLSATTLRGRKIHRHASRLRSSRVEARTAGRPAASGPLPAAA